MSLKITDELCIMTVKKDAKVEEELSCRFKNDIRFLTNFAPNTQKSSAKKVQRSYVSWHWGVIQNLKENWLVLSKMTWEPWKIFTGWKIVISF